MLVRTWLDTPFDAGRHARRLEKITALEKPTAKNGPDDSSSCS
jgi:ribose 5-phosphate isomerase RpiB